MDINRWSGDDTVNIYAVPNGAPEGWLGGDVNYWGRETMAAVRRGWEDDEWRDISMSPTSARYTITRDSATTITVGGVDLSSVLFVGQRIKLINSVAAEVLGIVASVTYGAPDTEVVCTWDEGDDDGTDILATTTLEFTAGSPGSVERGAGSWVADAFATGDRLRVVSTLNTGFYDVSNVAALTMDLVPVQAGYAVVTEAAADFGAYRIESAGGAPGAPLTSLWIAGSQVDQLRRQDVSGINPLDFPSNELLGDAAYLRENELSVADSVALGGATPGPGNGLDADTVDGLHGSDLGLERHFRLTSDDPLVGDGGVEETIAGLVGLELPGTPDGAVIYALTMRLVGMDAGGAATSTWRVRNGDQGDITDAILLSDAIAMGGDPDHNVATFDWQFTPAAGDIYLTVTHENSGQVHNQNAKGSANSIRNSQSGSGVPDEPWDACFLKIKILKQS